MKNTVIASLAAAVLSSTAFCDTIAQWTFETSIPLTGGPLSPEVGSGSAQSNTGGTFSNPAGWATAESWSSNGWNDGEYFQFEVSAVGFTNIGVSWQQTGSNTGPKDFILQYSVDGISFTNFQSYSVTNDSWNATSAPAASVKSYDLSSIVALNGDASIFFRITQSGTASIGNATVAATGTGRVDSFTVTATPVPEPSAFAAVAGSVALGAVALRRRRPAI